MNAPEDDDLRRAFAELRRVDAESAPAYDRVRGRPSDVRVGLPTGTLLVAASLTAAVIAGLAVRRPQPPPAVLVSLEHWTAPTDFLLETPGREILHGDPGIGTDVRAPAQARAGVRRTPN